MFDGKSVVSKHKTFLKNSLSVPWVSKLPDLKIPQYKGPFTWFCMKTQEEQLLVTENKRGTLEKKFAPLFYVNLF